LSRTLTEPHVEVTVDLLDTAAKLLNAIDRILDPSSQFAHLGFEPVHAEFGINCRASGTTRYLTWPGAAILPLQQREIPLQTVETILHGPIL
jgi:hypothetical protein